MSNPFHRVRYLSGRKYVNAWLRDAGVCLFAGHGGNPCPENPLPDRNFIAGDYEGLYDPDEEAADGIPLTEGVDENNDPEDPLYPPDLFNADIENLEEDEIEGMTRLEAGPLENMCNGPTGPLQGSGNLERRTTGVGLPGPCEGVQRRGKVPSPGIQGLGRGEPGVSA